MSPYVWTFERRAELANLFHLSRTALARPGPRATDYERRCWAAAEYAKAHPECSSTAAYKELTRPLSER